MTRPRNHTAGERIRIDSEAFVLSQGERSIYENIQNRFGVFYSSRPHGVRGLFTGTVHSHRHGSEQVLQRDLFDN